MTIAEQITNILLSEEYRSAVRQREYELRKAPESTASYWNGDSWGSIEGIRDAQRWVDRHMREFIREYFERELKK